MPEYKWLVNGDNRAFVEVGSQADLERLAAGWVDESPAEIEVPEEADENDAPAKRKYTRRVK